MTIDVSFYSPKGGTGKTTLAMHFAMYLKSKDYTVEFVDLDPQASARKFIEPEMTYSNHVTRHPKSDFRVIDFPPSATLSHKPLGFTFLISEPSLLGVEGAIEIMKSHELKKYCVITNKYDKRRSDHVAIHKQVVDAAKSLNSSASHCIFVSNISNFSAVERSTNRRKTLFNLDDKSAKSIFNFKKAKDELSETFDFVLLGLKK